MFKNFLPHHLIGKNELVNHNTTSWEKVISYNLFNNNINYTYTEEPVKTVNKVNQKIEYWIILSWSDLINNIWMIINGFL